ncbi:hypothetical protein FB157_12844 [Streptomyces sp. BK340]|nr:hypothetical protein FB157_12844 [Streptomyces sp. BK340]
MPVPGRQASRAGPYGIPVAAGRRSPALAGVGAAEYDPPNTPASWEDGRWAS